MVLSIVIFLVLLVAGAYRYFLYAPPARQPALTGTVASRSIVVGGTLRSYLAYTPATLPPDSPLLIILHGTQQNGATIRSSTGYAFDLLADRSGFVVLYPTGLDGAWNDCRPKKARAAAVDDVGFITALIAQAAQEYATTPQRVYLFGYSNGGQMVFRLISQQPDRFAGVAVVGANLPTAEYNQCDVENPTPPILFANGTADPITPFAGGKVTIFGLINRGFALSAKDTAQHFAARNAIEGPTQTSTVAGVEHWVWNKADRAYVEQYAFEGAGHVVPQALYRFPRLLGATPSFDLPKHVIAFFGFKD